MTPRVAHPSFPPSFCWGVFEYQVVISYKIFFGKILNETKTVKADYFNIVAIFFQNKVTPLLLLSYVITQFYLETHHTKALNLHQV